MIKGYQLLLLIFFCMACNQTDIVKTLESNSKKKLLITLNASLNCVSCISSIDQGSSLKGWQLNATNTGLAGVGIDKNSLPTYTGTSTPPANTAISRMKITKQLDLSKGGITISQCWISPAPGVGTGVSLLTNWTGAPATIQDCDFDCNDMTDTNEHKAVVSNSFAFFGNGNVLRCHLTNMGQGIRIDGLPGTNLVVENNLIHNLWTAASSHVDAITIRKSLGDNLSIRNNWADSSDCLASPAMFIQPITGHIDKVTLSGNYFDSTNWDIGLEVNSYGYGLCMRAINNRFGTSGFGSIAVSGGPGWALWQDNYINDDTEPDNMGTEVKKPNPG